MDEMIARLNIQHFRGLLATKLDKPKREIILKLLVEEERKLQILLDASTHRKSDTNL